MVHPFFSGIPRLRWRGVEDFGQVILVPSVRIIQLGILLKSTPNNSAREPEISANLFQCHVLMLKNSIPVGMREYYGESFAFCTVSTTYIYIYIYDPKPGSDTSPCEKPPKRLDGFGMEHLNLHILANFWWLSTQVSCETTLFSVRSAVLVGKWDFLKEDKPCTHTSFPANQPWKSFGTVFAGLRFLPVQKFGPEWPWVWEWWTSTQPWRGETSETSSLKSPQQTCSEKRGCGARGGDPFFRILQQPLWGGWSVLHARHLLNWADGKFQGHSWGLHRKWQENEDFLEDFYFDVLFCFWGSKSHFFLKSFWEVPPKKRCPFDPLDA